MTADWKSGDAYRGLRAAGRSALAWELLRRDPGYRAAARRAVTSLPHSAPPAFVQRWGLHFRRGSETHF
ncbi:MAG: transcriptional regulator domain-containing protein [Sphingomonas sp.]